MDEKSWHDVFTKEELLEIQNEEPPLVRQTPEELDHLLKEIHGMISFLLFENEYFIIFGRITK